MNWMESLVKTYESLEPKIEDYLDDDPPLLPPCITTQKAHIQIVLDEKSRFVWAKLVEKNKTTKTTTPVPCTEESAGRSSTRLSPHPFCDKLQYVAADYKKYGGSKKSGYEKYLKLISAWCDSAYAHPTVKIVRNYVLGGTVIQDLVNQGIILLDDEGKFADAGHGGSVQSENVLRAATEQENAFVRWELYSSGKGRETWKDRTIWESWKQYCESLIENHGMCSVTGEDVPLASKYPKGVLPFAANAKIISSKNPYAYKGRFRDADNICSVGYDTVQKSHNTLKWLIGYQGTRSGDLIVVSWATSGGEAPNIMADNLFLHGDSADDSSYTGYDIAKRLNSSIRGYYSNIGPTDNVSVMALKAATTGRLSILMYRELAGSSILDRVVNWNTSCAWIHKYAFKRVDGSKDEKITFIGAPAPRDIAKAAYGEKADQKTINRAVERLLPCILDGTPIPIDITESAIRKASNPTPMEEWEWKKSLSIACSLFKKSKPKEMYEVTLDEKRKTRDYLYGRLLAIADKIESTALYKSGENRQTNAWRSMQRFREAPFSTWPKIHDSLNPYISQLGGARYYVGLISQVTDMFSEDDFKTDGRLSGEFLLGFYSQREDLHKKKAKGDNEEEQI
jgi:CRISPR-associated protein Csd1